ncbi:MAG: hypothetical protein ABL901_15925 [Hyphomicrobiaceae bacterium]|nr:hypothetical protein [Hyphomicrobiaceae bacterium]
MPRIANLTLHEASDEQKVDGVFDVPDHSVLAMLLTFQSLPDKATIGARASALADIARETKAEAAMIGGALWLMAPLESALRSVGINPVYAFSVRESTKDVRQSDGSTMKTQVFRHAGWIWV